MIYFSLITIALRSGNFTFMGVKYVVEMYCSSWVSAVNHFYVQSLYTVIFLLGHQLLLPMQNPGGRIKNCS